MSAVAGTMNLLLTNPSPQRGAVQSLLQSDVLVGVALRSMGPATGPPSHASRFGPNELLTWPSPQRLITQSLRQSALSEFAAPWSHSSPGSTMPLPQPRCVQVGEHGCT